MSLSQIAESQEVTENNFVDFKFNLPDQPDRINGECVNCFNAAFPCGCFPQPSLEEEVKFAFMVYKGKLHAHPVVGMLTIDLIPGENGEFNFSRYEIFQGRFVPAALPPISNLRAQSLLADLITTDSDFH